MVLRSSSHFNLGIDYLSVSDSFKAVLYFYSVLSYLNDNSAIETMTLTIIIYRYPRNLTRELRKLGIKSLENRIPGIYTINTSAFLIPIQLVIVPQLRSEDCLWLHSLTKNLAFDHFLEQIKQEYRLHKEDPDYHMFMDTLIRANTRQKGGTMMWCNAMYEIFADDLKAREERGKQQGIDQMASLTLHLLSDNYGIDVIKRAAADGDFRESLMKQYRLL